MAKNFRGFFSLGQDINKAREDQEELKEGVVGQPLPDLDVDVSDEDLIKSKKEWEKAWNNFAPKIEKKQKEAEEYWLGKHHAVDSLDTEDRPMIDNLIFESLEEFLPVATRQNPEPTVAGTKGEIGAIVADGIKDILVDRADTLRLKLRMKKTTRYWAIYLLGVIKTTWDGDEDNIGLKVIRTKKLILDPESTIDVDGTYEGEYIGEVRKESASDLIAKFPNKTSFITKLVNGKLGTKLQYTEWWTNDLLFWTLKDELLDKTKNPHWNYEEEDKNHFKSRKMPYTFLSIFNLGKTPMDDTSLILQNLSNQDVINKTERQIDKNIEQMNGGGIASGDAFSDAQAQQAARTLRRGGVVLVPSGDVNTAFTYVQRQGLPSDVFNHLTDTRSTLRNIFGTTGISSSGIKSEQTVRGKLLIRGTDDSRIGGGISEFLEQFADNVYNWMVQMVYVYYSEKNIQDVLGEDTQKFMQAFEQYEDTLRVSVKEGSLIPKDDLTQRNEAVELWSAGASDPLTLFEKLEDPDAKESAVRLMLFKGDPINYMKQILEASPEQTQEMEAQQQIERVAETGGVVPQVEAPTTEPLLPDINAPI